jgi:hypothetical protein
MGKVTHLQYVRRMYHQNRQLLSRLSLQVEHLLSWNYWDFALCSSPGILETRKQRFGN